MKGENLLLDTHVFLWWRMNDASLSEQSREAIATADLVFVSAASAWEVAIKSALDKLRFPGGLEKAVIESGFEKLPISFVHAEIAGSLPPHHNDPFDRMLVAQAITERLTLVTNDRRLEPYDVSILWA